MPKKLSVGNATIPTPLPFFITVCDRIVWMYPLKQFINYNCKSINKTYKFTVIVKINMAQIWCLFSLPCTTQRLSSLTTDILEKKIVIGKEMPSDLKNQPSVLHQFSV